ncbi:MAG: hypothetical protein CVT89_07940 [Candidatus Altiarchaeales archaeon HGW-Altiarchaeales-2]|nr:MAG: hypothetical protein CVT89_07940 [Candidatus Altiarchaeales archaeon HGW-Altiarchaeales-2]
MEELKQIRDAENKAENQIKNAKNNGELKIKDAHSKRDIIAGEKQKKILAEIETGKKQVTDDAKSEREKILKKNLEDIKGINEKAGKNFDTAVDSMLKAFKDM